MSKKYFKTVWEDGTVGTFESNSEQANKVYKTIAEKEGGKVTEITKKEYDEINDDIL